MSYKLIACDLDGTLLDSKKEISKATIDKINELLEKGLYFVIATGRPYTGVKRYLDLLNQKMPVILYNGSVIRDSRNNEVYASFSLDKEDAIKIIKIINEHKGTYIYWKDEVPYVNKVDDYINNYVNLSKVMPKIDSGLDYENITKIIWFDENENLKEYQKTLFSDLNNVNNFTSEPIYLEFVNKHASKENALIKISNILGIKQEEVIAIGDGENDLGMIRWAGTGVSMGNSKDNIKKYAKYITKSNDDEGVLKALNELIK